MKLLKHGLALAVMAVASLALMGGSASAAISPDPYSFGSSDGGSFSSRTALGTSACDISGLGGSLSGTANGASGSVTAATASNCRGVITGATVLTPLRVEIDNGDIIVNVAILITNALGGSCLYSGTLTGTATSPTSSITASNSAIALDTNLGGFCSRTADANLTINTGASISW